MDTREYTWYGIYIYMFHSDGPVLAMESTMHLCCVLVVLKYSEYSTGVLLLFNVYPNYFLGTLVSHVYSPCIADGSL